MSDTASDAAGDLPSHSGSGQSAPSTGLVASTGDTPTGPDTGIGHKPQTGAGPTPEEFGGLLPETRRALHHRLATAQRDSRVPSVVAAVVRDGHPVWVAGRGAVRGAEPDGAMQYRIGSLTKTLVAVAVLQARDDGLLVLGDRVDRHLGAIPVAGDATIAQLLSHSAGLAAESRGPWWERTPGELRPELADLFGEEPRPHPPGRLHHYSNPGFALLGEVVARVRGESWFEVLRRGVLQPLGMVRTTLLPQEPHARGWAVHPYADVVQREPAEDTGRMAPAGQLWSTVDDLCRFAAFLAGGDERVLSAESLAEMCRPEVAPVDDQWGATYGLGTQLLRVGGRLLCGHGGSMPGFVTGLWASSEDRLAAVAVGNATSGLRAAVLAAELVGLVADREPAFPEPWYPVPESDPELVSLAGPWYWGTAVQELRVGQGGELTLGAPGVRRGSRFRPAATGEGWVAQDGYFAGERLRLVRGADGAVSHLDLGTFVFTRHPYDPAAPVPGGTDPDGWH